MNIQEIKSIVMRELPGIIRTDDEVRRFILKIGREEFLDQSEANRRFDRGPRGSGLNFQQIPFSS